MKVYPFYKDTNVQQLMHLHGDSIHMHIHCSSNQLQHTYNASNIHITLALKYLGVLFEHTPYLLTGACVPFQTFLSSLFNQYDDNTWHDTSPSDTKQVQPHQHSTLDPRSHCSITSLVIDWNSMWPHMTQDSPDLLLYTHDLVSSLSPANRYRVTMSVINHIYIGIFRRSTHANIRQYFSTVVTQQQRTHERRFPRWRTTPHTMSVY